LVLELDSVSTNSLIFEENAIDIYAHA